MNNDHLTSARPKTPQRIPLERKPSILYSTKQIAAPKTPDFLYLDTSAVGVEEEGVHLDCVLRPYTAPVRTQKDLHQLQMAHYFRRTSEEDKHTKLLALKHSNSGMPSANIGLQIHHLKPQAHSTSRAAQSHPWQRPPVVLLDYQVRAVGRLKIAVVDSGVSPLFGKMLVMPLPNFKGDKVAKSTRFRPVDN